MPALGIGRYLKRQELEALARNLGLAVDLVSEAGAVRWATLALLVESLGGLS